MLRTGGAEWAGDFKRRFDPNSELLVDPRYVILPTEGELHILDVGAGPITSVGKRRTGVDVHLTAVDPLADEYNALLDSLGQWLSVETLRAEIRSARHVIERHPPRAQPR